MSLHHQVVTTPYGTLDQLTHPEAGLRLQIARKGAEMISLQARDAGDNWLGFLHRDGQLQPPASGWSNHATVMGYFLHRLWEEKSLYRGQLIRGGNHGFLRHFDFPAPTLEETGLCYRVQSSEIPAEAYPLRVSLELRYRLLGASGVEVEFLFLNEETELEAHLSFGLHPGFAVASLTPDTLLMPAGNYQRHLAPGNFLNGEVVAIPHPGGPIPFPVTDLPGSFLLGLEEVPQRNFIVQSQQSGWKLHLDFSECPYLTLWSEGTDYLCVEPCWGLPDCNPPTAFEDKPGIQRISPRGQLKKTFRLRPVKA